jgi:hypothetical protein
MTLRILLLLLLVTSTTNAQDWSPFNRTDRFNYQNDTATFITSNYFADSVTVSGTDSIFYLNRIVREVSQVGELLTAVKNQPQYWQRMMIRSDGGKYRFLDPGNKVIYSWAQLGQSWLYDSVQNILATAIATDVQIVFGNFDSVKVFSLNNGDTIILSKHYGLLRFPNEEGSSQYCQLVGIDGRGLGNFMPSFISMFNLQVPDTLCYYNWCYDASELGPPYSLFTHNYVRYEVSQQELLGDTAYRYVWADRRWRTQIYEGPNLVSNGVYGDNIDWLRNKADYPLLQNYHCNSLYALSNQICISNGDSGMLASTLG